MDERILHLLKKTVAVCRQTRSDGTLDRLRDLAEEIESQVPEVIPERSCSPLAGMDAAEISAAIANLRSTPEGEAKLAELLSK